MAAKVLILKIKKVVKNNKKKFVAFSICLVTVLMFVMFLKLSINPIIVETMEIKSKSIATRAMNSAISDVVAQSFVYDDLINIVNDENGNIRIIQANSLEINNLSKDLAQTTEKKISQFGNEGVLIPIGSFTGVPILVGTGPKIRLKVEPIGAVSCTFSSKFEHAGINQTNHKIYLKVISTIGIIMPLLSVKYQQEQQVLISESIIVGKVPEVYLYSDNLDNLLNFVPIS